MSRRFTKRTLASALVEWADLGRVAFHQNVTVAQVERALAALETEGPGTVLVREDGGIKGDRTEYRWTPRTKRPTDSA